MQKSVMGTFNEHDRVGKREVVSPHGYHYNESTEEVYRLCKAHVMVEIDLEKIIQAVARGAAGNKSGRCRLLNGLVRAKRIGSKNVVEEKRSAIPLHDGYKLAEAK